MSASDNEQKAGEEPETTEELGNSGVVDVRIRLPNGTTVLLPAMYIAETLATFKQILLDYQECAAFTCYRLHLRQLVNADGSNSEVDVACTEFTELGAIIEPSTTACVFELIPGEYNAKRIQDQLKRTNEILLNPPTTKGLVEDKKKPAAPEAKAAADNKANAKNNEMPKVEDLFKPIEFADFYGEVLYRTGNVETAAKTVRLPTTKPIADAVKSVFASGWNPPPPQRKVRGDLLYIEVVTANEGTLYITATASGFYVNKSNRSYFDPSPAANHCFSHELFDTLLKASPTLKTAWTSIMNTRNSATQAQMEAQPASPLDVMAWMFSQGRGHLAAEGGVPKAQWNAYNLDAYKCFSEGAEPPSRPSENAHHSYNLFRTQQELSSLQGVEELGAPREWNDEIQSIRALRASTGSEKIMKAKLEYKVLSEFAAACRTTAVAISEGLIAPLSMGEPAQSDIYMYNGIFFSKAEDTKDSFKICNGDEAYRKCASREQQNGRLVRSLEIEGVGLVLTCIVDYKGLRIIGQSVIPGIFAQGENVARLMYGILDKEKMLTVKHDSLKLMQAIGEKLSIPVRNVKLFPFGTPSEPAAAAAEGAEADKGALSMLEDIQASPIKVDDVNNVVGASSPSTPHCGAIEGKVLRGSDGRDYVLEVMRLAPRDANYVAGEKGTGKVALLDRADKDLAVTYVLRRELIEIFMQNKLNAQRQAVMRQAADKQKELMAALKAKTEGETKAEDGEKKESEVTLDEETTRQLAEEYSAKMKEITIKSLDFTVNPNCFLDFEFDVDAAVREKDEATARELALFLWDTVLPTITRQVRDGEVQPRCNATMVKILHRAGVNMRYLGALLALATAEEDEDEELLAQGKKKVHAMPHYWREMLIVELIARAAKYVLNGYYKDSAVYAAPAQTVASLLNHLLSLFVPTVPAAATESTTESASSAAEAKKGKKKGGKKGGKDTEPAPGAPAAAPAAVSKVDALFPATDGTGSREECLKALQDTIAVRFCTKLHLVQGDDSTEADVKSFAQLLQSRVSPVMLVRRICQTCGIQIATRKYNFVAANPIAAADVLGLVPIVKTCEPESLLPEFEDMLDSSRGFHQEGNIAYAYELAQQAMSAINQITGPYHAHAARAFDQLTGVLIAAGDFAAAQQYAHKSLAISIHLHGFDSQESAMHHLKLGIIEGELGNRVTAARHLQTAKYLLQLMAGNSHIELASIYTRFASLYEEAGDFESIWQCYARAKYHACDLTQICTLNIALAAACYKNSHHLEALELQRQAYQMLKELMGDREESLSEVKSTLELYMRTVNEQKIAASNQVSERLKEMVERMEKTKLQPETATREAEHISEQELFAAFAEIDARAEKAKKAAKKANKKVAEKPKK